MIFLSFAPNCMLLSYKGVDFATLFRINCRDVHETFRAETETRPETHVSETETRPTRSIFCPRRDRDETLQLPRRWPRP